MQTLPIDLNPTNLVASEGAGVAETVGMGVGNVTGVSVISVSVVGAGVSPPGGLDVEADVGTDVAPVKVSCVGAGDGYTWGRLRMVGSGVPYSNSVGNGVG